MCVKSEGGRDVSVSGEEGTSNVPSSHEKHQKSMS